MHFSEEDLKDALRRKDPGRGFTQRVMARVGQQEPVPVARAGKRKLPWWHWVLRSHPAFSAVAALVLMVGGGLGYLQYQRVQEENRVREQSAKAAEQKVLQALKITNSKLSHVFKRVNEPSAAEPKIRRETL